MVNKHHLVFKTGPRADPVWKGEEGLEELKLHLQTAITLELSTIPLYLYAAYSINGDPKASGKILGIVHQEMLHMGLAGNIMCAIGGSPKVYGSGVPRYPAFIFEEDKVHLDLRAATRDNILTFVELEAPLEPQTMTLMAVEKPPNVLPDNRSIGEFYKQVEMGITALDQEFKEQGKVLFLPETFSSQLSADDGSWSGGEMIVIKELKDALTAMTTIVDQGEGSTGAVDPNSHWQIFKELYGEHELICFPVVQNPVREEFQDEKVIYPVMLAFDAAYSYLLLTIEKLWSTSTLEVRTNVVNNNLYPLMMDIMRPFALYLVTKPLTNGEVNAAPPFNVYEFKSEESAYSELLEVMGQALAATQGDGGIAPLPIEAAMKGLMNVANF